MGCDGGTIPRRDELVRTKRKPEKKDKDSEREFRWLHCAMSQNLLQEPIVMCGLGRLYSKQNVIEKLLEKEKMPVSLKHIKSMKDIKTLTLTRNPSYIEVDKTEGLLDSRHVPYICKLIGLEMSGKFRFIALWSCGCVMSERALKQIKGSVCPLCQTPFTIADVIVLNGNEEDVELMQAKIEMRNSKRKSLKKEKNESIEKTVNMNIQKSEENCNPSTSKKAELQKDVTICGKQNLNKIATQKVKMIANPKRLGSIDDSLQDPHIKRLKTDYSVAKDPNVSDVYKSLFTSHKSEKEQTRAHWVTYNPFYN